MTQKNLLIAITYAALLFPVLASAQTIASMAGSIAGQVIVVGAWIVVIMWVVTGILFLSSLGDASKLNSAKLSLFGAIGGTILIILAQGAVNFVGNSFGI